MLQKNSPFCFFVTRFTVALGAGTGKNLDVRVVSKYEAKLADRTVRFWQKALANGADNCFVSVSNLKTLVVVSYKNWVNLHGINDILNFEHCKSVWR